MKMKILFVFLGLAIFFGCTDEKNTPNSDIGVAQAFIENILSNHFKTAETFLLKEDMNKQYFDLFKKEFEAKSKEELESFSKAGIIINEIKAVNDSVSIINYSNTFKKDKTNQLKMVRVGGQWLVDLKYTFSGNL